jgi:hypothetical protein
MRRKLSQSPAGIRLADTHHTVADGHPGKVGPPVSVEGISSALNLGLPVSDPEIPVPQMTARSGHAAV